MNRDELIEHQREEIKALKADKLHWIPVDFGLPKIGQECLIRIIVGKHHEIEGSKYIGNGDWDGAWCSAHGANKTYKVSAWVPLPKSLRD